MSQVNMKLRLEIYDLLISEFMFQSRIGEKLGVTRQTVSRHVKAMLDLRVIKIAIPNSSESYLKTVHGPGPHRPAINIQANKLKGYRRGPNAGEYDKMLKTGIIHSKKPQIRVHHTQYKMHLIKKHKNVKEISDNWKVVKLNDYVYNKYCKIPFKDYGTIGIQWTESYRKKGRLKVTIVCSLPPNIKYFRSEYGDLERGQVAFDIQKWFGKNGYILSLPVEIKEPHYGIDTGFKVKGLGVIPIDKETHIDSSPDYLEVEPRVGEIANSLIDLPDRLASIEANQEKTDNRISGLIYSHETEIKEDARFKKEIQEILSSGFTGMIESINQNTESRNTQELIKEKSEYKKENQGWDPAYQ